MKLNKAEKEIVKSMELYRTLLDLKFSLECQEDMITDLTIELKDAKKALASKKRLMKKGQDLYQKVHGRPAPRLQFSTLKS